MEEEYHERIGIGERRVSGEERGRIRWRKRRYRKRRRKRIKGALRN